MTASDGPSGPPPAGGGGIGPYDHVIVGTDGSATAQEAVAHAAELAVACGARLTVVSAYVREEGAPSQLRFPKDEDWVATDAAAANDHVLRGQELARSLGVQWVGARTESGDPAEVILDVAEEIDADVIVVGSRGMAAPSRFLLGSVPNRVSHHAKRDVVIFRTVD